MRFSTNMGMRLAFGLALFLASSLLTAALASESYSLHEPRLPKEALRGQPTLVVGDFYYVRDQRFELHRRVDEFVVQFSTDSNVSASINELRGSNGLLSNYSEVRMFAPGLRKFRLEGAGQRPQSDWPGLYADLQSVMTQVAAREDVAWTAPVFVHAELQTYAVASDEVLVRLHDSVDPGRFFADIGVQSYRRGDSMDAFIANSPFGIGEGALMLAASLQGHPDVRWAEPNLFQERVQMAAPNDLLFPLQWHLQNTGQSNGTPGADARLVPAWGIEPGGDSSIVIAVLDDGIELAHPDLRIYTNPNEVENGIDSDGNGYIDDIRGWDFTSGGLGDNDPGASTVADEHGTSVAGIAAARGDNSIGVAGASYNASVLPVRIFLGPTATNDANIGTALAYASGRGRTPGDNNWVGAHIVNNSWGGGPPSSAIEDALEWAAVNGRGGLGTPHFFATGNSGASSISLPARLAATIESVIAVGASSHNDLRSTYSQFGPELDFLAPSSGEGVGTVTTDRLGAPGYNGLDDLDYTNQFGGTSSASPLAAGVAGLILSQAPNITIPELRKLMRGTAQKVGPLPYNADGFNLQYGYGRINAHRALLGLAGPGVVVVGPGGEVASGDEVALSVLAGEPAVISFTLTSLGLDDPLLLGLADLEGSPAFEISQNFDQLELEIGETTTVEVSFLSLDPGTLEASLNFETNVDGLESFVIDLAVTVQPVSVGGTVYEDWRADGELRPGDRPLADVLVFLDLNDDGQIEPPSPTDFFQAANLPFGNSPQSVSSTRPVSGLTPEVRDVEVLLNIDHEWVGDVEVRLTSPSGQTRRLLSQPGGGLNNGQNFTNTLLTDSAASSIQAVTAAGAPYTGSFRPLESFDAFAGEDPNGDWVLTAIDVFPAFDDGELLNWTLIIYTDGDPVRFTDQDGRYAFVGLEPGSYVVRAIGPDDWIATEPAGGSHTVVVDDPQSQNLGVNFGYYRPDAAYGRVYRNDIAPRGDAVDAPGVGGVVVYLDLDDDGELSAAVTESVTRSPGLAIPDNNAVGVSDTATLPGVPAGARVAKVTVELNITHTFVGDLEVFLAAPGQPEIPLIARRGGGGDDFTGTVLDDDAEFPISSIVSGDAPFTGSYRPETPLSSLNNLDAAGDWVLRVADRAGLDVGTLDSWTLTVTYLPEPQEITDEFGNFRFDRGSLSSGPFMLRAVAPDPFSISFPASGVHEFSFPADDSVHQLDFGFDFPLQIFRDRFEVSDD